MGYEYYKSLYKTEMLSKRLNQMLLLLGVYKHAFTFHFLH